jgi:hypothetical protein
MKYNKMRDHVAPKGNKSTTRYKKLMFNEQTGAIFPISWWAAKQAEEQKRKYDEHSAMFYFMPGDICIFNVVPLAAYDTVPYGMTGKFETRKSFKSEYTYIHELFDKYESFPGMKVSMIDGKPLNARLLDDISCNPKRLQEFNEYLEELKKAFFVMNRLQENEPQGGSRYSHDIQIMKERRELLLKLLSKPLSAQKNWADKLERFYAPFYHRASGYSNNKPDHNRVFDNMLKFDKAALFRSLKVIE